MTAQQPKMYLKLFGGINTSTLVYRVENVDTDVLVGWQLGGGFRIQHRALFGEVDFTFFSQGITYSPREGADIPLEEDLTLTLRGFEIPLTVGYIPVRTPVFGLYLYGGLVNWFSLNGRVEYEGETIKFKPKDLNLHFYNLGARFGVQIDIAMINIDLNYTIGITNGFRDSTRTNKHTVMLNVGFLF